MNMDENNVNTQEEFESVTEEAVMREYTPFERELLDFYGEGGAGKCLCTKVCGVRINQTGIENAFKSFINNAELTDGYFRISDLLSFREKTVFRKNPAGKPGQSILAVIGSGHTPTIQTKCIRGSVNGIHELIARTPGFVVDIGSMPYEMLATVRFFLCRDGKENQYLREFASDGMKAFFAGKVDSEGRVCVMRADESLVSLTRDELVSDGDVSQIDISDDCVGIFRGAFLEVLRYQSLCAAYAASHITLKATGDAPAMLSSLLAVLAGQNLTNINVLPTVFGEYTSASALPFTVKEALDVYLFSPLCDNMGYPSSEASVRMNSVLRSLRERGVPYMITPVSESVNETVSGVIGEGCSFVPDEDADLIFGNGSLLLFSQSNVGGRHIGRIEIPQND